MRSKAIGLGGILFALNGVEDHIHMAVSIPASVAVSTFIGQVKGVASAHFNKGRDPLAARFEWQDEYGAFSFDGKRLSNVIAYVENQKQHHAQHTTIPILERTSGDINLLLKETSIGYLVEDYAWRAEMLALDVMSTPP